MAKKAVFMDRDDTLIEDPGYINHPNQVRLLPGAAGALIQLKKMGYLLIVATNQSGVARGIVSEETLEKIHHRLQKLLADEGAYLDGIYSCPYHPDGVIGKYRMESDLRKPNPGMLRMAAAEHEIDLSQSWMIGDSYRDISAGKAAGCRTILIDSPIKRPLRGPSDPQPDRKAGSLREAANVIRMLSEQEREETEEPKKKELTAVSYPPAALQEAPQAEKPVVSQPDKEPEPTEGPAAAAAEPRPAAPPAGPKPISEADISPQDSPRLEAKPDASEHPHPILQEILHLLRSRHRQDLYEDFSFFRLVAMITEMLSLFCLIASIWLWFDSDRPISSAQMMVGYALVLQLVTIALLLIKKDR